jgi:citronellol/citronellal dehydrogenase
MFSKDLFKGQVALVTGGGSGIGKEIARLLLNCGATVYIASRKLERLEQAMLELRPLGDVRAFVIDIRQADASTQLANFIENHSGKLDILINNAGGQFPAPAETISQNGWNAVVNTNLNGTWYLIKTMANRFFLKQKSGSIVNIVLNNYRGTPGMVHSGAARAGVMNLSQTLAVEWATRGIRINCVAPGIIQSSGLENYPPSLLQGVTSKIPMKRLGTVTEVAELTLFLAYAKYITGETVYVDGGSRLWGDVWQLE